jgi:hypothetical protein
MKVRAKFIIGKEDDPTHVPQVIGYFNDQRIREGDVFEIPDGPQQMYDKFDKPVKRPKKGPDGKIVRDKDGAIVEEPWIVNFFSERWMEKVVEEEVIEPPPAKKKSKVKSEERLSA